jgi:hypothetical protein
LGWIVRDREIDAQQGTIADALGIVGDADRFGMESPLAADAVVGGVTTRSAGIAGNDIVDALQPLEHRLHAPEAAAG